MKPVNELVVSDVEYSQALLTDTYELIEGHTLVTVLDLISRPDLYDGKYVCAVNMRGVRDKRLRCCVAEKQSIPCLKSVGLETKRRIRLPLGFAHLLYQLSGIRRNAWTELLVKMVKAVADADALSDAERELLAEVIAGKASTSPLSVLNLIQERRNSA